MVDIAGAVDRAHRRGRTSWDSIGAEVKNYVNKSAEKLKDAFEKLKPDFEKLLDPNLDTFDPNFAAALTERKDISEAFQILQKEHPDVWKKFVEFLGTPLKSSVLITVEKKSKETEKMD